MRTRPPPVDRHDKASSAIATRHKVPGISVAAISTPSRCSETQPSAAAILMSWPPTRSGPRLHVPGLSSISQPAQGVRREMSRVAISGISPPQP